MLQTLNKFQINKHCWRKQHQQQLLKYISRCLSATQELSKVNVQGQLMKQSHDLPANHVGTLNAAELFLKDIAEEWKEARPFKDIPGPSKLQMIRGFMRGGDFHGLSMTDLVLHCRQKYGDIFLLPGALGQGSLLSIFDPKDFEKVHRTEGAYPMRPGGEAAVYYRHRRKDGFFKETQGLMGKGKSWSDFRTKVNPVLMKPQNARLYLEPIQRVSSEFIQRIRDIRDPDTQEVPGNFIDDIQKLTFESVVTVALDKELGLLRGNANSLEAQKLFECTQVFISAFYDLGVKPSLYRYFPTPTYKRFERAMDTIFDITSKYIEEALARLENQKTKQGGKGESEGGSVLEKLIKIDRKVAIIISMDMLFGGVDTTASVLSAAMLLLAKNPEKQSKLRAEVLTALASNEHFTVENMEAMPYLRACIKEALRVYPITPGNLRETGRDIVLGGYRVPKGIGVLINSNMLLSEERYFPRPREFIPERWLRGVSEGLVAKDLNPFVYQPFGFGPRACIGKRIVALELELTLANLLRNFSIEFNHPAENAFATHSISFPAIPLKFKFTDL